MEIGTPITDKYSQMFLPDLWLARSAYYGSEKFKSNKLVCV